MISEKALRIAAKELVEVMELVDDDKEPIVITKDMDVEELTKLVKEAIPEIKPKENKFTDATQAVIDELSEEEPAPKKKAKPVVDDEDDDEPAPPKKKAKPAVDDEDDDDDEPLPPKKKAPPVEDDDDEPVVVKKKKPVVTEDDDDDEPVKPAKKAPKEKKEREASPYGTTVTEMCKNPNLKLEELNKKLIKQGIDVEAGKSAVQTGYGVVRKIVGLLRANGFME